MGFLLLIQFIMKIGLPEFWTPVSWADPVPLIQSPSVPAPLATSTASSLSPAAPPQKKTFSLGQDLLNMRDPFSHPDIQVDDEGPKSELERYPVDAFKLIGVLTGPERMKALLETPDNKTFLVSENMKIGLRGGVIRKITPEKIQIRERIVNLVGQEENIDSDIRLPAEGKLKADPVINPAMMMGISGGMPVGIPVGASEGMPGRK